MSRVHLVQHPLLQDHLTHLRQHTTDSGAFRQHMGAAAAMLFYEAARLLPTQDCAIQTPLQPMQAPVVACGIVLVSVLRAGLGFLDGILPGLPSARVGYLGLARNPQTLAAESYYSNLPKIAAEDHVFVLDPMLATGHTVIEALRQVRAAGARHVHLITLLASPEGLRRVEEAFPEISLTTAAIDTELNARGYILPGLGDAGDRLYGTAGH